MKIVSFRVSKSRIRKKSAAKKHESVSAAEKLRSLLRVPKLFKKLSSRKARVPAALLALALLLAAFSLTAPGRAVTAAAVKRDLPIYCVQKDSNVVSLTFDAAWGNEDTQQLIDILGKYNVKATFFVVGEWAEKYPESVRALFDAGHEIMNHSDNHDHYPKLSPEQIAADLQACNDKIEQITGVRPALFRPPYGDYSDKVVAAVRGQSMYTIQWDVDSLDWKDLPADDITKRVLSRVQPGSIVLFHNAAKNTPAALDDIIEGLIRKGYGFARVSELILTDDFEIDHSGRQCPKR